MDTQTIPLNIVHTTASDPAFLELVRQLNAELTIIDGEEYSFYAQFNKTESLQHVVVAYVNGEPVACGALKPYKDKMAEIKRMFVVPSLRGRGIATSVLHALEKAGKDYGYKGGVLETGQRQQDAVALYIKNGYTRIPNYGQYEGVENSICMKRDW